MLQALTASGKPITPAVLTKHELRKIRLIKRFFCPRCRERVIFRAGQKVIPHFAHQSASYCSEKGGESAYHMEGKLQLYQWLRRQYTEVHLEKYIAEIKQRPDILLKIAHRTIAIELQCAVIDSQIIRQRNAGYKQAGITPIWLLGANFFKRIGKHKMKVNSFMMEVLQKFSAETSSQLIYYCPATQSFFKASNLHLITNHHAIAHLSFYKAHQTIFPQLLISQFLNKQQLNTTWLYEKKRLRLGQGPRYGRELKWRQWLYQKGYYVEQLPAVIHLPVASQYLMKVPTWHWQSRLIIDFLHPLSVRTCFSLNEVTLFLQPYMNQIDRFPLIQTTDIAALDYLILLTKLGYIKRVDAYTFRKKRAINFPSHINQALEADENVLRQLLEHE